MGINKKIKVILCGGGTGGHIFPMLSIADEIKKQNNKSEILFVGSKDRMEMKIVPKYNYPIKGLWISGIKRSSFLLNVIFIGIPFILKNISLPFKIFHSLIKSLFILIQ
ncbi:MAG: glycosyltransferase, partial [Marinoscillum sp.]